MSWKFFIGAAFICNVLVGNICLIKRAEAAPMPNSNVVMSKSDPTKCPWITQSKGPIDNATAPEESPCATGHCFAQPDPHTQDKIIAVQEIPSVVLPVPPCPEIFTYTAHEPIIRLATHGPPIPIDIGTIVMTI